MPTTGWEQGAMGGALGLIFVAVMLWSLPWKGIALWKAARRGRLGWFVALLIINTAGLLEIIYIFFVSAGEPDPITEAQPLS